MSRRVGLCRCALQDRDPAGDPSRKRWIPDLVRSPSRFPSPCRTCRWRRRSTRSRRASSRRVPAVAPTRLPRRLPKDKRRKRISSIRRSSSSRASLRIPRDPPRVRASRGSLPGRYAPRKQLPHPLPCRPPPGRLPARRAARRSRPAQQSARRRYAARRWPSLHHRSYCHSSRQTSYHLLLPPRRPQRRLLAHRRPLPRPRHHPPYRLRWHHRPQRYHISRSQPRHHLPPHRPPLRRQSSHRRPSHHRPRGHNRLRVHLPQVARRHRRPGLLS